MNLGSIQAQTNATSRSASAGDAADTYQLVPQDKLVYRIEEDPVKLSEPELLPVTDLNEVYFPVSRGSDIRFPINVRGKTVSQVKKEVKTLLDRDYYQNCSINLWLADQNLRKGKAIFFGEVTGEVQLNPGEQKTVAEAIVYLKYGEFANLKKVKLNRIDSQTKKPKTIIVNVEDVLKKGDRSKDEPLQDGDRIEVLSKNWNFLN